MSPSTLTLNDGTQAPWIAFGTGAALIGEAATTAVTTAIQNGFTHLIGSQVHNNEEALGAGIAASGKPRSELYITTKLGKLARGENPESALQKSLAKLGVEYVDLYLIHHPRDHGYNLKKVWKGMEKARQAGLTKSIGVSNLPDNYLEDVLMGANIVPAVNQVEAHPYVWRALRPHLAVQNKHDIVTFSYGGLMPIDYAKGGPLDPVVEQIRARLENARGSHVSSSQVILKWLQKKGMLVAATSSEADRIKEYLDTENVPELRPEELELIETTGIHYRFFSSNWPRCEKGTWHDVNWIQGNRWDDWIDV